MSYVALPGEWVPYQVVMDHKGKEVYRTRLDLGKRFMSQGEISQFFLQMHKTHPHLVGTRVDFDLTQGP